jgi:hypothetical protein
LLKLVLSVIIRTEGEIKLISIERQAIEVAVEVFETKCNQLVKHRNPSIFLQGNSELFSDWFEEGLNSYQIIKLGANAHPDIILNGVGFELKSLKTNGQIQFNSTIPCGGFKHGNISGECYYAIARYATERNNGYLQDFTICDGDFLNHDRQQAFSHANEQQTGFGDYGDGVVRHRKMYSFPSPIRAVRGISLISKFPNVAEEFSTSLILDNMISRTDTTGKVFDFYVYRHRMMPTSTN